MFHDTEQILSDLEPNTRRMGGQVISALQTSGRPAVRRAGAYEMLAPGVSGAPRLPIRYFTTMIANAGRTPFAGQEPSASREAAPE